MRSLVLLLLFGVFPPCSLFADVVYFKNGDRLTGRIEQLGEGKLTFNSDMAGKMAIDIDSIRTFSSEAPLDFRLADGTTIRWQAQVSDPNHITIPPARQVAFTEIVSVNAPAKPKWTGDLSAGLTSTHGNTRIEVINASANFKKRTEKDRTQLASDYALGRQEDPDTGKKNKTEDWWRAKAKYDYFLSKKLYGYLDGRYETDDIALLDRRVIIGSGAGYQWVESDDINFSTEAGMAWLHEKFEGATGANEGVSLQFGYNFDKKLHKNIKFVHDLTYYPSTENFSDYLLTSTVELRAHFTETMFTNFKAILNYDDTPAQGKHKTDVKYIWGIGWSF
jgi:putative salt-induced outer membrane protein YdiY